VIKFGFSAFLKLLSLNDKPQRTEIRRRLAPSSGGGYDFHDSLRRLAHRYLVDGDPMPDLLASAGQIVQPPERLSAVAGLERLALWRAKNPAVVLDVAPVTYESPQHLFKVEFKADFAVPRHGEKTAIHIWNTKTPALVPGAVYAALSLIAQACENEEGAPDDFGVLSLREPTILYLLSEAADWSGVAATLVERIEDIIQGPALPPPQPEDHPSL
jgi:hypothetical protein